ncbi:hypothetical protein KCU95_g2027, partial [Aureobasidium melanogenum]
MRAFNTAIVSTLLVAMSHMAWSQDCDLIDQQACCYTSDDSGSDTTYCCNGSIVGNFGSGSDVSALNDLVCCQDDGRTGLSVGLDFTTCRAGSATPLTAKGTAASSVADAIKSISASRGASRESLFSSASASRASAAAASATVTSAGASSTTRPAIDTRTGSSGTMSSSSGLTASSSSNVSGSESDSSSSAAAAGATSNSSSGSTTAATSSSSGSAAAVSSSATSTGGVAMMTLDVWNAAMAGGAVLVAAVL